MKGRFRCSLAVIMAILRCTSLVVSSARPAGAADDGRRQSNENRNPAKQLQHRAERKWTGKVTRRRGGGS